MMNREMGGHYDRYRHRFIDRRVFIKKMTLFAGGAVAVNCMLPFWDRRDVHAAIVSGDDPRLHMEKISYPGATGEVGAYLARPKESGKRPGVVVIHENRGLNAHIEDVTRRIALGDIWPLRRMHCPPLGEHRRIPTRHAR